jgi:hypothetical protein
MHQQTWREGLRQVSKAVVVIPIQQGAHTF